MKYRADIDGLRAFAVLPVVAYHAGLDQVSGGFAGVDVFFVISGFLITSIILTENEKQNFSLMRFYERRARRILPALLVVMSATAVIAPFVMVPYQLEDLAQSVIATLVFASNVLFWFETDYFAAAASTKPLLHTWSLAVEEQFYLMFPLVLMLLFRIGIKAVYFGILGVTFSSLALTLVLGQSAPSASFFLIQFRAWELSIGALTALWLIKNPPKSNQMIACGGLLAILISFFLVSETTIWPGPLTLLPALGTAAVLAFSKPETSFGKLLSWEPLRRIGLISYSLYLWHLPPIAFLSIYYFGEVPTIAACAAVAFSFFAAWLSWRCIERPFRVPGLVNIRSLFVLISMVILPLSTFSIIALQTNGFQTYMLSRVPEEFAAKIIDRSTEVNARRPIWNEVLASARAPFASNERHKVLILGDSLSGDLAVALAGFGGNFPNSQFRRVRLDDKCMPEMANSLEGLSKKRISKRCAAEVDLVQTTSLFLEADEIVLAANWQPDTIGGGLNFAGTVARFGKNVSILGVAAFNDMASLSMQLHLIEEPENTFFFKNIRSKFDPVNNRIAEAAQQQPSLRYLDKLGLYCDRQLRQCEMTDEIGKPVIFDSAHVTVNGAKVLLRRIEKAGWFR